MLEEGGMISEPATQFMRIGADAETFGLTKRPDRKGPGRGFFLRMNMSATLDQGIGEDKCVAEGPGLERPNFDASFLVTLLDKLVQGEATETGAFLIRIDKTGAGNNSMSIDNHGFADSPENDWIMKVRGATVTMEPASVDSDNESFTATFTGGDIEVTGSKTGKTPDHVHITCRIQDDIVVTVDRS